MVSETPTLAALLQQRPFEPWVGYQPNEGINSAREVIYESLRRLSALGHAPDEEVVLGVIQIGVERFNDLDGDCLSICTIEREDIAAWFNDMAEACGVTGAVDVTEPWREW